MDDVYIEELPEDVREILTELAAKGIAEGVDCTAVACGAHALMLASFITDTMTIVAAKLMMREGDDAAMANFCGDLTRKLLLSFGFSHAIYHELEGTTSCADQETLGMDINTFMARARKATEN